MSIKKLINALFKLSCGQAMPEIGEIATVSVVGDLTYTAPADGYISLSALGQISDWKRVSLQVDVIDFLIQGTSQYFASGWLPVKKGQSVKVSLKNGSQDVAGSLIFMKLVGGGINRLLALAQAWIRGGVLWLTSSTTSRLALSLSSRVRRAGLGRNRTRQLLIRKKLSKETEIIRNTYPLLTDTLMCKALCQILGSVLMCELYLSVVQRIRLAHQGLHFLLEKENHCRSGVLLDIATIFDSLRTSLRNSLNAKEVCHA